VISDGADELDWKTQIKSESSNWDVYWTDGSILPDVLIRMNFHQKINHYPGIHVIARKNLLGLNLMSMRKKYREEYDFFPQTWMLPSQYSEFRQYYENIKKGKVRTYIVKP
jgi:tubulin polyglutamylase TTLL6/13